MKAFIIAIFLLVSLFVTDTLACTTFCLKGNGEVLFGRNYDWMIGDALLFVNKRGVSKTATGEVPLTANTAKWVSKYGSVTFNQYGRENPTGGMNEAGLVVEIMWLDETEWPKADSTPAVGSLEWIQYQLDTAATVNEVIKNAERVRITSEVKIHYLVNDKAGNSATIEFLNGKLTAHTGDKLPVAVLANDTYEKSVRYASSAKPDSARSQSSLDRFTRAAKSVKDFQAAPRTEKEAVDYAFRTLLDVGQKGYTQWSIVYDQKRGKIHFKTLQSPAIKTVDVAAFDYSCGSPVKMFDINSKISGDVSRKFSDYTRAANRDLLERSFTGTPFLKEMPGLVRDILASYPESFTCGEAPENKAAASAEVNSDRSLVFLYLVFPVYYLINQVV